jgi:hypothetical protein
MSAPSIKSLVTSTLALSICLAPFQSMAAGSDQQSSMANRVATAAGNTLEQVQKQNDAQLAKLMSEYAATTMVILDMKAANLYSQVLSSLDDPTLRMSANAVTYTVVVGATTWQAWKALARIGKIPSLIKATPGLGTKITAFGGAALRTAAVGGVAYTLWRTNTVLLLEKQDYNEILMRLEADALTLEKQLGAIAKAKMNPSVPAASKDPGAPTNSDLFKLE